MRRNRKNNMGRPRLSRHVSFDPNIKYFKPQGVPLRDLEEVSLTREEVEALRLKNIEGLDQVSCAEKMKTSQSTFQRIITSAYYKISLAIVDGQAIKIDKN